MPVFGAPGEHAAEPVRELGAANRLRNQPRLRDHHLPPAAIEAGPLQPRPLQGVRAHPDKDAEQLLGAGLGEGGGRAFRGVPQPPLLVYVGKLPCGVKEPGANGAREQAELGLAAGAIRGAGAQSELPTLAGVDRGRPDNGLPGQQPGAGWPGEHAGRG